MKRLEHADGSWQNLLDDWSAKCRSFEEDFDDYMSYSLPTLAEQCETCHGNQKTGVYSYQNANGEHLAVCFLNAAYIPKFTGRVLRVRHLVLSPEYDFGDYNSQQYAELLAKTVAAVIDVSENQLKCPHIKIHFRSPADVAIFRTFAEKLKQTDHFTAVNMVGSWLQITK